MHITFPQQMQNPAPSNGEGGEYINNFGFQVYLPCKLQV